MSIDRFLLDQTAPGLDSDSVYAIKFNASIFQHILSSVSRLDSSLSIIFETESENNPA